jgi:hypothetical protein
MNARLMTRAKILAIHRQVVHGSAIHMHLAVVKHWWQHPRNRHRCAQPAPQQAVPVYGQRAGGQVRRHAEERQWQVLDLAIAELSAQQPRNLAPRDQRHQRQGVVIQGVGINEGAAEAFDQFLMRPFPRHTGAKNCAQTVAAYGVDGHAGLAQRAHYTDMREAAGTATG